MCLHKFMIMTSNYCLFYLVFQTVALKKRDHRKPLLTSAGFPRCFKENSTHIFGECRLGLPHNQSIRKGSIFVLKQKLKTDWEVLYRLWKMSKDFKRPSDYSKKKMNWLCQLCNHLFLWISHYWITLVNGSTSNYEALRHLFVRHTAAVLLSSSFFDYPACVINERAPVYNASSSGWTSL